MTSTRSAGSPLFSIIITTYNRAGIVERCVATCVGQTDRDFEVLVVDDGSTDDTSTIIAARFPGVRVIRHDANRGINPARATAVSHSRGEWIVVVDSDWELLPHTLERLRSAIAAAPDGVGAIRSRLRWDDGSVTPTCMPTGLITYADRIAWLSHDDSDCGRCFHRSVFEEAPYIADRRGAMELLWELNLARITTSLALLDVLGLEHATPDSHLRGSRRRDVVPRLLAEAPDMLWMAETTLREHGPALAQHGPRIRHLALRVAAQQAFLCGRRTLGTRYALRAARVAPWDLITWSSLLLGALGPRPLANGMVAFRGVRGRGRS